MSGFNVEPDGDDIILTLEPRTADRLNTILLRHAVGKSVTEDTAANRDLAAEISNAIERWRPRPMNATPEGDEA